MSTELVTAARPMSVPVGQEVAALEKIATNLAHAGIYKKTAKTPQEVFAILLAARDMGVAPTSALAGGIHMVDGKPEVSANLQAQLLREYRGPEGQRYDYRVLTPARERSKECHLEFRRLERGGEWEVIGEEFFGMEDAQRAGLAGKQVWKAYPKMMLLARCLSDGIASHCPETARGLRVYGEGEIGGQDPAAPLGAEAAPVDASPAAAAPPATAEEEPVDAIVVETISDEKALLLEEGCREARATRGTIRLWLTEAGAPRIDNVTAAIRSLTEEQADVFGARVLGAVEDLRGAAAAAQQMQETAA